MEGKNRSFQKERKMFKKLPLISILLVAVFVLVACGPAAATPTTAAAGGEVYYLNFKPEVAEIYQKIADEYKLETGVTLKVVTAASGTYEQTLKSEIAKADAPVLFQINGPRGYASWADYCADLKDTELYKHLSDKSLAVSVGDAVYGIPYVVEGYGIIYNNAIMTKYFALEGAKAASMAEINNFAKLKEVVEDMTSKKDQLGIKGVFSSTSLKPGEDWRWQTHLANVAIYYEVKNNNLDIKNADAFKEIKFEYSDNFKNIFDLYINNSTVAPTLLEQASAEKQQLAADFIYWLYSSPAGKAFVTNDLKFIAPFDTFAENEKPTDPLAVSLISYMSNTDLYNVAWDFVVFPGQTFKDNFGAALLQYAQGTMNWDAVKQLFIDQWKIEAAK
jgi:ABC-type glycerol-3-phosphate transport system substrate-binding protein